MSTTKNQQKASRKWNEGNLERIYVTVKKGQKDIIKKASNDNNESINSFINHAIEYYINMKKG